MTDDKKHVSELDKALDEGTLEELPPNVPPGIMGEAGVNVRKVDTGGPYGTNAGLLDEWTWETTMLVVTLTYIFFFPAAFYILWKSNRVPKRHKQVLTLLMVAGLAFVAYKIVT